MIKHVVCSPFFTMAQLILMNEQNFCRESSATLSNSLCIRRGEPHLKAGVAAVSNSATFSTPDTFASCAAVQLTFLALHLKQHTSCSRFSLSDHRNTSLMQDQTNSAVEHSLHALWRALNRMHCDVVLLHPPFAQSLFRHAMRLLHPPFAQSLFCHAMTSITASCHHQMFSQRWLRSAIRFFFP